MRVVNCCDIIDVISLSELVRTRDIGGVNVKYLQPPPILPQQQLMTHSQYFEYQLLSCNLYRRREWLREGRSHTKYLKIAGST